MGNIGNGTITREINFAKIFISGILQVAWKTCRTNGKEGVKYKMATSRKVKLLESAVRRGSPEMEQDAEDKVRTGGRTTG